MIFPQNPETIGPSSLALGFAVEKPGAIPLSFLSKVTGPSLCSSALKFPGTGAPFRLEIHDHEFSEIPLFYYFFNIYCFLFLC